MAGHGTPRGLFGTLYQSTPTRWNIVTLFDLAGNKKAGSKEPASDLLQRSGLA
jgi:hypothetical protein